MRELTLLEKELLQEKAVEKFALPGFERGLEKLYWHFVNELYDESVVREVLEKNFRVDTDTVQSIVTLFSHKLTEADTQTPVGSQLEETSSSTTAAVTTIPKKDPEVTATTSEIIDPVRTMEEDVDRIHGYGAYRDLYPDAAGEEEPVHRTSQDDVLSRKPLAETPKYQVDESPQS